MISTILLVDKLIYDEQGNQRPDAFARMVTAMGRALYGNADKFANMIADGTSSVRLSQKEIETNAYTAGVAFLERLIASDLYKNMTAEQKQQFQQALTREKASLENWKRQ